LFAGILLFKNSTNSEGDLFIMFTIKRKEMNIAAEMHYELNASAFARDFYALGRDHEGNRAHSRIGMSVDIDH
jgi:hypothetical protein